MLYFVLWLNWYKNELYCMPHCKKRITFTDPLPIITTFVSDENWLVYLNRKTKTMSSLQMWSMNEWKNGKAVSWDNLKLQIFLLNVMFIRSANMNSPITINSAIMNDYDNVSMKPLISNNCNVKCFKLPFSFVTMLPVKCIQCFYVA